jgi:hypothetical protein
MKFKCKINHYYSLKSLETLDFLLSP